MALQVWLPLNGNLNNNGIDNITVTNSGATVDNNGKIGKCYSFNGSSNYLRINEKLIDNVQYTISFWMYATNVSANHCIFSTRSVNNGAVNIYLLSTGLRFDYGDNWVTGFKPTANTWYHIAFVQDTTKIYLYVNGVLNTSTTATTTLSQVSSIATIGCEHINGSSIGTYFSGKLNDFRIWNGKALSPKEIEILSRGLVCHYPLCDRSNQTSNNVFTNSTFASSSGWNFWGQSGHSGTWNFTQNKDYIFNKTQTNACIISNGASATGDYLMYQSPAFSGGFRSLQAIIKEENSSAITDSIVYPVWNASASGSTPLNHWTSINDLGDGFYLCRCESIKQDGSNNLVGIYVKPGYKIYVSECYCENDRTVCSDFFYPSTTVYDTSGYQYNGTVNGLSTVSSDTARYSVSTKFDGSSAYIEANPLPTETKTISCWLKTPWTYVSGAYQLAIHDKNTGLAIGWSGSNMITYVGSGNGGLGSYLNTSSIWEANKWMHVVIVKTGSTTRDIYINGVKQSPSGANYWGGDQNTLNIGNRHISGSYAAYFNGQLSDFRAYSTALSAEQVAELYNTAVSVANNGTLMGYELVEV